MSSPRPKPVTFTSEFFAGNRRRLLERLQHGSLVVVGANAQMQRANDTAFAFQQSPDFWYLTGLDEADWWLIIDGISGKSWLVHPDIDDVRQLFDGSLAPEAALERSGVDEVIDRTQARQVLAKLARSHKLAHVPLSPAHLSRYGFVLNPGPRSVTDELRSFDVRDCRRELDRLRAQKQPIEVDAIRYAISITAHGYADVVARLASYKHEYEIEASLTHQFRARGADGHAYDPIVAADDNACTLHYRAAQARIKRGSVVLIDAAASYQHYAADVTRTYAIGKASSKQAIAIYEAVRRVKDRAIELCRPGVLLSEYQKRVDQAMAAELTALKMIDTPQDEEGLRRYFPHAVSHGLGLDVHDSLGGQREFVPGMVVTVEPGIYDRDRQLGIRLEDDIVITDDGHQNLSAGIAQDFVIT